MREIVFTVTPCVDSGGYVARWDDSPGRGGITTQGDTLQELQNMVREAVDAYFEVAERAPWHKCVTVYLDRAFSFSMYLIARS